MAKKKKYDYLVVGAGLFGSVFARRAADRGKRVLVIDQRSHTGGNCHCVRKAGIWIHRYGPHIFHTHRREIWDFVREYCEFRPFVNSPLACKGNRLYNLPFNMNTFHQLWGVVTPREAREKIASQRVKVKMPRNLEEQALSLVGRDIYETLIRGYTEKQWGRPCRELPAFIIRRIPLRFTYNNNYYDDPWQGVAVPSYNRLFEELLRGIPVELEQDFICAREKYRALAGKIIYTGRIDGFYDYRHGALDYRSLEFRDQVPGCDDYQGNAVVNYTGSSIPWTRIIEHRHFYRATPRRTVITREYPGSGYS